MLTVIIDYGAGNLHSAVKAFERMARETNAGDILLSDQAEDLARADRIVLPGDGAFPACMRALRDQTSIYEALIEAVEHDAKPFLGICVGMQLMARKGTEYEDTEGLGWIDGEVHRIAPNDNSLKIPHMGWNDLIIDSPHPVLQGLSTGDHCYFVHSYQMDVHESSQLLAHCDYGGPVTAIIGCDNMIGTQFHPEKSQSAGLRLIANWLNWSP